MFVYSRKVSFIDYYINGVKSGNIGVVRQKVTEENLFFEVEIFGLEKWRDSRVEVGVGNNRGRKKLFELKMKEGKGKADYIAPLGELRKEGYDKVILDLGSDCYGIADLCELPDSLICDAKITEKADFKEEEENISEEIYEESEAEEQNMEEVLLSEEVGDLLSECMEPQPDKWEIIKKKYPILYPFKGQGPYVSIKPVDLQLLNNKYHHLSSNSYLMHGFYQYRHMILGEYSQDKGTFFYVGVPGEFVKKEQDSAAMFGFEGYEHSGDLGYYLYRVEL